MLYVFDMMALFRTEQFRGADTVPPQPTPPDFDGMAGTVVDIQRIPEVGGGI